MIENQMPQPEVDRAIEVVDQLLRQIEDHSQLMWNPLQVQDAVHSHTASTLEDKLIRWALPLAKSLGELKHTVS